MSDVLSDAMALLPIDELAAVTATAESEARELRASGNPDDHARAIALEAMAASGNYALLRELARGDARHRPDELRSSSSTD